MMTSRLSLLACALIFAAACASVPPTAATSSAWTYEGVGESVSPAAALKKAKLDALRKAVQDLLGPVNANFYKDKLNAVLATANPDLFLYPETLKPLNRNEAGDVTTVAISIKVNLPAVRDQLVAQGVTVPEIQGVAASKAERATVAAPGGTDRQSASSLVAGERTSAAAAKPAGDSAWGPTSEDDLKAVRKYLQTLRYMVYYDVDAASKPSRETLRFAVAEATAWLVENGLRPVDAKEVEKIRESQFKTYEEETKGTVSFNQWVARRENAGVYFELGLSTTTETGNGKRFFAQAVLDIKGFDPATGQVLASVPYKTNKVFSMNSEADAVTNAVTEALRAALPQALEQAHAVLSKALVQGIQYDLVIQKTSDSKLLSQLRRKLQAKVKQLNAVSSTAEETRLEVFYSGSILELEDLIYGICDSIPGLEGMYKVMQNGRVLTLNTGL